MPELVDRFVAGINAPTMIAAAVLVLAVIVVIRFGRLLLMAALVGALAGGVSLGRGHPAADAGANAAVGFGVAAVTMLLARMARGLLMWILITIGGVAGLILADFGP